MNVIAIMRFPVHGFQCDLFFSPSVSVKLDKCNEAQDAFCCLRQVKVNLLNLSKTLFWWYLRKIRKKCPNFEKWKWTSFTADQLQSAGNLASCVRQKQLFHILFLSDNNFPSDYKNFGNCNREALLLCRTTGSPRERQFWGRNRTDRACLAPSLETKMEEFFQINLFPGPFLRQIIRRKITSKRFPDFLSSVF